MQAMQGSDKGVDSACAARQRQSPRLCERHGMELFSSTSWGLSTILGTILAHS